MKPQATTPLPPKLWMTRQLAREAFARIFSWRPAASPGLAWAKSLSMATYFLKSAAFFVLAMMAAVIMPFLVLWGGNDIWVKIAGTPSIFAVHFRPIEINLVNAERWSYASSSDASSEWRQAMDSDWSKAVEQAHKTHSTLAMIDSRTVDHLRKELSISGARRRDVMLGALVEALSAGESDAQSMDKARQALALSKSSADPMSLFASEFGPIQTCGGFDLTLTVLPFSTTPSGPCAAVLNFTLIGRYFVGLTILALLIGVGVIVGLATASLRRSFSERFKQWSHLHSDQLMARWESQQMRKEANAPPTTASTRRPRL